MPLAEYQALTDRLMAALTSAARSGDPVAQSVDRMYPWTALSSLAAHFEGVAGATGPVAGVRSESRSRGTT
jgi:hypothetical protein